MSELKPCPLCGKHFTPVEGYLNVAVHPENSFGEPVCILGGIQGTFQAINRRAEPDGWNVRKAAEMIVSDVARVRVDSAAPFSVEGVIDTLVYCGSPAPPND